MHNFPGRRLCGKAIRFPQLPAERLAGKAFALPVVVAPGGFRTVDAAPLSPGQLSSAPQAGRCPASFYIVGVCGFSRRYAPPSFLSLKSLWKYYKIEIACCLPDDALLSSRECLGCVLHGLEEDGEDIPAPTPLTQIKTKENERADQLANLRSCSISIQDNAPLFMNRTERSFSWRGNDTAPPTACRRSTYMSCGIPL